MSEKVYDEEIAQILKQLSEKCASMNVPFFALVEYAPNEYGRTQVTTPEQGFSLSMTELAFLADRNIDAFIIGLARHCRKHGINTDASIVMNQWNYGTVIPSRKNVATSQAAEERKS
ncbi:hypothetical protein [Pandoraea anhela]|uniref:Uncharacterized protein n=1 Tax=Pandoraea anhela TaxID=2508295 RepID=A0A5E4S6D1_9BURK|nr:hypothetical protein [Pandoraea anhela]VVD70761.1 hypothetical protein PAN31108_00614 [Pandoraea anhela]